MNGFSFLFLGHRPDWPFITAGGLPLNHKGESHWEKQRHQPRKQAAQSRYNKRGRLPPRAACKTGPPPHTSQDHQTTGGWASLVLAAAQMAPYATTPARARSPSVSHAPK
ncbi:hypothetical protein BU14_0537s0006 [Porphyra umbilicalis]|uniref:Uncharacterized protein n=1 Tax=Porphyra umbilicalis TaxID=2786 RepID=A0A1X6NS37_PORUM|nr:hypothetical protein BU14_0537s0006 [Porphyra umbilicalis]|eukprot:OSX71398.1 hypothetical protein BU14_0537s0006 [Porphyra umbilicalis]